MAAPLRLVVLGGSGASTPELADALAAWPGGPQRRPPLELVLQGRSADKLALVAAACRRRLPTGGPPVPVRAEPDLARALEGAAVVLVQVRVGGLAARVFDETFPHAVGLPGEETMGPGGFANALRTVPALVRLWATAVERAPDALYINLTNPSGIVVAAVDDALGARLISVCDSPVTFCGAIAARLGRPIAEVRARYQGTNHLGWWVPGSADDLEAVQDLAQGQDAGAVQAQAALGAPYVRYHVHPGRILAAQQSAAESRAQQLQRLQAELLAGYQRGDTDLPRRGAVWYGMAMLPLVDAWINGSEEILTVGLRNDGRLPQLPEAVVTEGPVRIRRPGRLEALPVPDLPALPAAMLDAQAAYELLTVAAAREGAPREARVRALMANPLVTSWDQADALVAVIEAGPPA